MHRYFDYAATSPLKPQVREALLEALDTVGNPSSIHGHGQRARAILEDARERVAECLSCDPAEVVFTSGGTESINLAVKGLFAHRQRDAARPIAIIAEGEHHATLEAALWLRQQGAEIVWLPVDHDARVHPATLRRAIAEHDPTRVALISVMFANNEVGTVQPISELAAIAANAGIPMHVDAVAALGQVDLNFADLNVAALSLSAHKVGGPVGVGALLLSRRWMVEPLFHGGDQQRGRSGTMDVAGAVALATALELEREERDAHIAHLRRLQLRLIEGIQRAVPDAVLRGAKPNAERLPSNVHFTFPGCAGDSLLFLLDQQGFSVSTGSACHAGVAEVSHVLIAMGIGEATAIGALRFTLGDANTEEDIDALVAALPQAVAQARVAGVQSAV